MSVTYQSLVEDVSKTIHKQQENIIRECLSELIADNILVYKSAPPTFNVVDGELKVVSYGKLESCHQELIDQLIDTAQKLEHIIVSLGHESLLENIDEVAKDFGFNGD